MRKTLLSIALVCMSLLTAYSEKRVEIDGIRYTLDETTGEASVSYRLKNVSTDNLVIADEVVIDDVAYPVTTIVHHVFHDYRTLVSLTLGKNIRSIDQLAFDGCTGLKEVVLPKGLTDIGESAFQGCSSLSAVSLSEGLKVIGDNAFARTGLKEIQIPESVESIGEYAFSTCTELTKANIPASFTSVGKGMFMSCASLGSISIPDKVKSIGEDAFKDCRSLASIAIPEGVEEIGAGAFADCRSLTSVSLPSSVKRIGSLAFSGCAGLEKAEFASMGSLCGMAFGDKDANPLHSAGHLYVSGKEVTSLTLTKDSAPVGKFAFAGCTGLASLYIEEGATPVGDFAFQDCTGLTSLTLSEGVRETGGSGCFSWCSNLEKVSLPASLESISDSCFLACYALKSVSIPAGTRHIGYAAFDFCNSLEKAEFASMESLFSIEMQSNPLTLAHHLYINGEEVTTVVIPGFVEDFNGMTLSGGFFDKVVFPETVKSIGMVNFTSEVIEFASWESFYAVKRYSMEQVGGPFLQSYQLAVDGEIITEPYIPENLEIIPDHLFSNCRSLSNVRIPETVTRIGTGAFAGTSMGTLTLTTDVAISRSAFEGNRNLSHVYCYAGQMQRVQDKEFFKCPLQDVTLHVPESAIDFYKENAPWNEFGHIMAMQLPADNPNSIQQTTISEKDQTLYDLSGRKLNSAPQKGIYIQNGKKVLVK